MELCNYKIKVTTEAEIKEVCNQIGQHYAEHLKMDKLKLAHDYAMKHLEGKFYTESEQWRVAQAWQYADMMLAEQEKRTDKTRPAVLDEFQVDWSQAPEWANWWAMDFRGRAFWYESKPFISETLDNEWLCRSNSMSIDASSFNYQGNWRDSLRGRK